MAREECVKVPVVEVRRVPSSSCLPVTDVLCYNVLTPVKDVVCQPVVSRDCRNVSVEVPYIKEESQCDEIVYDECQEVERRVPVEICKRRRFDENSIFLSRGRVFRKAGEKRRKTIFRRTLSFDTQKKTNSSTARSNDITTTPTSTTTTTLRPNVVINPVTETEAGRETELSEKDIDFRIIELY